MKRIQYSRYGGPEVMEIQEFTLPKPGPREIAVRVEATSINPIDWKIRNGEMKMVTGKKFPRALGVDFAGTIIAAGEEVKHLKAGDSVFGLAPLKPSGAFANAVIALADHVVKRPEGVSVEQASCLPTAGITAWNALVEKAHLQRGQKVFIHGCSGSVGQSAVQLAKRIGATVVGTCSSASASLARERGVDTVLDSRSANLSSLARQFDAVFDTTGTLSSEESFRLLKPKGVVLDIHPTPGKFLRSMFNKRLKVVICTAKQEILLQLAQAAADQKLQLSVGARASLQESLQLIRDLEGGARIGGKGVIFPNS